MPDKKFLENYPLYQAFQQEIADKIPDISKPSISFFCTSCESFQTHVSNEKMDAIAFVFNGGDAKYNSAGRTFGMNYSCAGCASNNVVFFVKIASDLKSVMKVGQEPAWDITGDKRIEKMLGTHKSYLRRGMICESQGYGIAAFAYYRRIAEEVIDKLIGDIEEIMPDADREAFAEAYGKVKTTRQTSEKISLIKDLLPSSLTVDGMNPLGILHSALSEGLHAKEDEACLKHAKIIREALIFLCSQISETKTKKREFTGKMRHLLAKKG